MTTLYPEYSNQNSQRNYPFDDLATLLDTRGVSLPTNFIVDINMFVFKANGVPYIKSINIPEGRIIIGGDGNTVYGFADMDGGSDAIIYDSEDYMRQVGVIIFGAGLVTFNMVMPYSFTSEATSLCPTAWFELNQIGVRGFLLDDGTLITGNVIFEGRNGINILSYVLNTVWFETSRSVLKISADGAISTIEPTGDCLGPPIKCIRLINDGTSLVTASDYELDGADSVGIIAISPVGYDLTNICPKKKIPDSNGDPYNKQDICITPVPPGPHPDGIPSDITVCPKNGSFIFLAPSTADIINPVVISYELALAPIIGRMYSENGLPIVTNYNTSNYSGIKLAFKGTV